MDKYNIEQNFGLDTLAERSTVRRKDNNRIYLLSKMEMMDMGTTAVAYQEYQPLLKLSPENVASYIDIFTSVEHEISAAFVNLISEYFPMGNLDQYLGKLRNERQALDHQLMDKWFAQILDGLMYLWRKQLIHRNLRPDSIYLRGNNDESRCSLIVGDMIPGSVAFDFRMRTRLPRRALSYTAPEIFRTDKYTIASDIYSFGCCLLDVISCDQLTDEETLQLRICARHDLSTLSETLENLHKSHETLPKLIGQMMAIEPSRRPNIGDFQLHDYVIESMHVINSSQIKYPSKRDSKTVRNDLSANGKLDLYVHYLKQHKNTESRVEYAIQLCNQSKLIDPSSLASSMEQEILPVVEDFRSNMKITRNTLELFGKAINDDRVVSQKVVTFLISSIPMCEKDEQVIGLLLDLLIRLATRNAKLLVNARRVSDLVHLMSQYEHHAVISGKSCSLLWLIGKDAITNDLRMNQNAIFRILLNILQQHPENSDLYTKVCFAFSPFIFQRSTLDYLVQFNLVRHFTLGLQEHQTNRHAIKAGLAVLSELFKLDERCVLRFLCSRTADGKMIDTMTILTDVFDRYKNETDIARGVTYLLKSMSRYDDAIDEMISTKIEDNLLFHIKRFHSDDQEIVDTFETLIKRIHQRS